jgi:selenocysteine lyase/cysteine desulfurase
LINAKAEEIALVPNTSAGINLVADGLDWRVGDNVVIPGGEFPSNLFPWKLLEQRGVELRVIPLDHRQGIDLRGIAEACDARTRVVAASWVGFSSGYRVDVGALGEIADRCGAHFFLDAIQGLGVFPLDVRASGVDFLAADGHKWMLGPEGAGLFFVRHELLEALRPQQIGWRSVKAAFDYSEPKLELVDSAARFEGGTQNLAGIGGLLGSLQLLESAGLGPSNSAIAARVLDLGDELCERLSSLGAVVHSCREPDTRSGIVSFSPPQGNPDAVRSHLMDRGIVLSCRGGRLRCAVHGYNDESDVARITDELRCITD